MPIASGGPVVANERGHGRKRTRREGLIRGFGHGSSKAIGKRRTPRVLRAVGALRMTAH